VPPPLVTLAWKVAGHVAVEAARALQHRAHDVESVRWGGRLGGLRRKPRQQQRERDRSEGSGHPSCVTHASLAG